MVKKHRHADESAYAEKRLRCVMYYKRGASPVALRSLMRQREYRELYKKITGIEYRKPQSLIS